MLFSKNIILTMAVATPLAIAATRVGDMRGERKLQNNGNNGNMMAGKPKKPKKPRKPKVKTPAPTSESYSVVSSESDIFFIPAMRSVESVDIFSIQGSQFIRNGAVYDATEISVEDGLVVGIVPNPTDGSSYNQQCTSMDGVSSDDGVEVYSNMCNFTLCVAEKEGCLLMQSGGPFKFNPFDTAVDAVPTVTAIILGGTGGFSGYSGTATIDTLSRTSVGGYAISQIDLML